MIHTDPQIINPETLQILKDLQSEEAFNDFVLVGGTSLALQMGHRHSIDLDLFSILPFDNLKLEEELLLTHQFNRTAIGKNTLKGFIEDVKVDFITHAYPWVEPVIDVEDVRIASCLDIAAMKLNAISGSGERQKDFYDIYFLLEWYSLSEMLEAYLEKYTHSSSLIPVRALSYFDDIRFEIEPPMLVKKVTFSKVKERLIQAINKPDKRF